MMLETTNKYLLTLKKHVWENTEPFFWMIILDVYILRANKV